MNTIPPSSVSWCFLISSYVFSFPLSYSLRFIASVSETVTGISQFTKVLARPATTAVGVKKEAGKAN